MQIRAVYDRAGSRGQRWLTAMLGDYRKLEDAHMAAWKRHNVGFHGEVKRATRGVFRGQPMSKSWGRVVHPKGGKSAEPNSVVLTSYEPLVLAQTGATLRPSVRRFMAIPLQPAIELLRNRRGIRLGEILVRKGPAEVAEILGVDRLIPITTGRGERLLVGEFYGGGRGTRLTARPRGPTPKRRRPRENRPTTVPLFLLVPTARAPKRMDAEGIGDRWTRQMPEFVRAALARRGL